jgi:hypothetical protein
MSSNAFLSAPEIPISFAASPLSYCWQQPYISLQVNSVGAWCCRTLQGLQPVLLLHDKSVWLTGVAGLTVQSEDGCSVVIWLFRREYEGDAWRRSRAWFVHSQRVSR